MKVYREIKATVVQKQIVKTMCDLCGEEICPSQWYLHAHNIVFAYGKKFPGGDNRYGFVIEDLCDECVDCIDNTLSALGVKTKIFDGKQ